MKHCAHCHRHTHTIVEVTMLLWRSQQIGGESLGRGRKRWNIQVAFESGRVAERSLFKRIGCCPTLINSLVEHQSEDGSKYDLNSANVFAKNEDKTRGQPLRECENRVQASFCRFLSACVSVPAKTSGVFGSREPRTRTTEPSSTCPLFPSVWICCRFLPKSFAIKKL
jgi:hypothetical protein